MTTKQMQLATSFTKLHQNNLFILPNAWNGGSAKVFEKQGFKAVATTSAGIAYSLGYADGECITFEDLLRVTKQIVKVVNIPVSVDMERGYGVTVNEIKENVKKIIQAGAVGINIEDGHLTDKPFLDPLEEQVEKIKAIVGLKNELGVPFIINARTCAFWLNIGDDEQKLSEAIKRGNAFARAGADCVFIPGGIDKGTVKELVNNINAPINIVANPVFCDLKELNDLGVKRLSIGSGAVRAAYANLIDISQDIYQNQRINSMLNHNFSYQKANEFFKTM